MFNFIAELRRRHVLRVAGAYAVVGWLLAQVSVTLETALELPNWFDTVIVSTLLIGFPIALLLAWAFEITPEGVKRSSAEDGTEIKAMRATDYAVIAGLLLVSALAAWQLAGIGGETGADKPTLNRVVEAEMSSPEVDTNPVNVASIAVLPFADLSADGDQEYFSDGIAEEILNVLARVDGLKVASRTSSFQFKGRDGINIPDVAQTLEVAHVLEGSVRKAGDTVRITAQLIRADSDTHLWSQTFDRRLTVENIFEIQDEIATGIVSQLGDQMDLGRVNTLRFTAAADTDNLRAYEAYLEARDLLSQRSNDNLLEIIGRFELATQLDPNFGRAWEALAAAYYVAPTFSVGRARAVDFDKNAKEAAEAALAINDQLPLAIAISSGGNLGFGANDTVAWMEGVNKGLSIDPDEAVLIGWRGQYLTSLGYFEKGEADLRRALEIDPLDWISASWLIRNLILQRRVDEALGFLTERADLRSANGPLRGTLALALAAEGRQSEAEAMMIDTAPPGIDVERMKMAFFDPDDNPEQAIADFMAALGPFARMFEEMGGIPSDMRHNLGDYKNITAENTRFWETIVWLWNRPDFMQSPHRYQLMQEQGFVDYWRVHGFPPQCRQIDPLPDGRDFGCD